MNQETPIYWRKTRRLTLILLVLWCLLTFGVNWFARELNQLDFLGFPFGFYMGAQGALILYLLIIVYYNRKMRALDAEYGQSDSDDPA
jgi:putative solute:sodium symporter small subunit